MTQPGMRLVAARERDDGVEHVPAGDELDRVGDHLAADERGLHALGAHGDPVGDRDRVELHRGAAGGADAVLHALGQAAQVEVARHRLGPGVGDADDRPAQGVVVEADALEVGAGRGPVRALEDRPAAAARRAHAGAGVRARAHAAGPGRCGHGGELRGVGPPRWRSHSARRQRSRRTRPGST